MTKSPTTMTVQEYRAALKETPRQQPGKKINAHTELVRAIVARLNLMPGVDAIQMNTGEIHREGVHVKFGHKGMADIYVRAAVAHKTPGAAMRTLWLEAKTGTGKQKPDQKAFQEMVERWGDPYIICRSIDDAERAVEDINA